MKVTRVLLGLMAAVLCLEAWGKDEPVQPKTYAWTVIQPLGLRTWAPVDTSFINYSLQAVPSAVSPAWATTGNFGAPGINLIFSQRTPMSDFMFADGIEKWIPSLNAIKFYNSRIPVTFLSYNFGGSSKNFQDRLQGVFSGNVNKELQFGAMVDYLYSKGCYNYQSVKDFAWGFNGSYIGEKFEVQFYQYHYNLTNLENGGIEDDLYITDPAAIQGGNTTVDPKSIPTNLSKAQNRNIGGDVFINAKYKLGFWKEVMIDDSTTIDEYVPVTAFIWTFNWKQRQHEFRNVDVAEAQKFWPNRYLLEGWTDDKTKFSSVKNTLGVSLIEGFSRYAKFGLAAYAALDIKTYTQTPDSTLYLPADLRPEGLDVYDGPLPPSRQREAELTVGAQLTKQQGSIIKYEATGELGITGRTAGDIYLDGNVSVKFPFLKDSLQLKAFGRFTNTAPSYFAEKYISNHFIWDNDFSKTRRLMVGGELSFPRSFTKIRGEIENLGNYIYFDRNSMPQQHGPNVQVITLFIQQNFKWKAIHLDNTIVLQKSTNHNVIPLPKFAVYSNLYFQFKIAKVLDVQMGADIDYYARHRAIGYQPATMMFYNDGSQTVGGFPFMNVYANMKLGRVRFYLMYSHVNKGLFGKPNYFSIPHYPLNPGRFQLGLSVEFNN